MPKLHIDIDIPGFDNDDRTSDIEKIEITHLAARLFTETDFQTPHTPTPGVSVFIPQSDSLNLIVGSKPTLLVPGLAYLLGGDADRRLASDIPGEEGEQGAGPVQIVEINALINGAVPLRETLRLPAQLDAAASEEAERLCILLAGHEKSLFLTGGSVDVMRHMIAVQLVTLLLVTAGPSRLGPEGKQEVGKLIKLKQFMMRNLASNPSVLDMASYMGMSRTGFYDWATPLLGKRPPKYLRELRLDKSQELILNTSLSIDQIAERTGFSSRHHLTREFAKYFQTTPAKARRLAGKQDETDLCSEIDARIRDHQFSQALMLCNRGLEREDLKKYHSRLRYQQGRCLYALGDTDESVAAWQSIAGTEWAHEAGKKLCNHFFRRGKYARSLSILADLYPEASPDQQRTLVLTWSHRVAELINQRLSRELPRYLSIREELFVDDLRSMGITADALNGLGMANQVPNQCAGLPERCFQALRRAGLYRKAIDTYGTKVDVAGVLIQVGEYEEGLAKAREENNPEGAVQAMVGMGRAEEAIRDYPEHCQLAYVATGRYEDLIDRWPEPSVNHIRALQALGRTEELMDYPDPGSWLWLFARFCADPATILDLDPLQEPVMYYQALFVVALEKLQKHDDKEAEDLLARIPLIQSPTFWCMDRNAIGLLLTTAVRGLTGAMDVMQSELAIIRDNYRYFDLQRIWHDACFLLGDMDEQHYRDQPCKAFLEEKLKLVSAIVRDLAGDRAKAGKDYRTIFAALNAENNPLIFEGVKPFITWRLQALA